MIALINFTKPILMTKVECEKLKLTPSEKQMVWGYKDGGYEPLRYGGKFRDECEYDKEKEEFYTIDKDGKREAHTEYYLFGRIENLEELIEVEQYNQLVDLNDFAVNCKYPYSITSCVKNEEPSISNINAILAEIEKKTQNLLRLSENMKASFNEKVSVHMGGGLITTYNELLLKEDVCTDELQQELNNGWRILGVCVQPDQRRPDYILGRYNPNLDVTGSDTAKR
ncbi:MAG: hypothetical protein ACK5MV_13715 [Aminipila sp.]